jgi:site-specific DNA recombinase
MLGFLKATPSCRTILVEKTDQPYRNIKDWITVDDLELEVHFVRENAVVSKESRSSDKFGSVSGRPFVPSEQGLAVGSGQV